MENASKALIIAGAILLSILIIGLGVFIFNMAQDAMGNINMNAQEVQAYNSPFLQYEGIINGSNARTLCNTIVQHNNTAPDSSQFVTVLGPAANTDASSTTSNGATDGQTASAFNTTINTLKNQLRAGNMYEITFGYDPNTGYIVAVGFAVQQ